MNSRFNTLLVFALGVCFFGGFFFWPLFIPAAIFGWLLRETPEQKHEAGKPQPKVASIERAGIKGEDPDWKQRYLGACESPAESAFLAAMINAFSLQPVNGVLKAPGLSLNMQVEMKRYRLDFLANGWLIIEIDGAAWHSSPEAVARDKVRDEFFDSYDYTVLRIPAKVVFSTAGEAVKRVRAALAQGPKVSVRPEPAKPVSALPTVAAFVRGAGKALDDLNKYVEHASAVQEAMSKPKAIYGAEQAVITGAMRSADIDQRRREFLAKNPDAQESYYASLAEITAAIEGHRSEVAEKKVTAKDRKEEFSEIREKITPIIEPSHPNADIDVTIKIEFATLMKERQAFFDNIREKLTTDRARKMSVQSYIFRLGCLSCWAAIAPKNTDTKSTVPASLGDMFRCLDPADPIQIPGSSSAAKPSASINPAPPTS